MLQRPETLPPRIINYPALVNAIQLSVARLLDIEMPEQAKSFAEVLENKSPEDQERLICRVGERFDDELIYFITTSFIAMKNRRIIILADKTEGVNGELLWEPKLKQHLNALEDQKYLRNAKLDVIRYSLEDIELLVQEAEARASQLTPVS